MKDNKSLILPSDVVVMIAHQIADIRAMSCVCKQWARAAESLPDLPRWRLIVRFKGGPEEYCKVPFLRYGLGKMREWGPMDISRAAQYGNLDLVKHLAGTGMDIHIRGNHPIRAAIQHGHFAVVQYLVDIDQSIVRDKYLLQCASYMGHLEIVQYLASARADIAGDVTVLRFAAEQGHLPIIQYLAGARVDIHANSVALQFAAKSGHLAIVRYLVNSGANVHAGNDALLHLAVENGHHEIVQYLVEARANMAGRERLDARVRTNTSVGNDDLLPATRDDGLRQVVCSGHFNI